MKKKKVKNIATSVHDKLLKLSKATHRDFNSLLRQFFQERFLYRLSLSSYKNSLILKGALLLVSHGISRYRPTRDIDFLGRSISADVDIIKNIITEIASIDGDDGVDFNTNNIRGELIKESDIYGGIRIHLPYKMGSIIGNLSLDVGFGDEIVEPEFDIDYPVLIDLPSPKLNVYSLESSIAEKFEAIVKLNFQTSRMKDFYDIVFIADNKSFKNSSLKRAIEITFKSRGTDLRDRHVIFKMEFKGDKKKQLQWSSFIKKNNLKTEDYFIEVVDKLESFINPIFEHEDEMHWNSQTCKWE